MRRDFGLLFALVGALVVAPVAQAADVVAIHAGANLISFDGAANLPTDFELGATGRASLSPHLSLVGSGWFGFDGSYLRGTGGVRVTATDVENPDFSVGLGMEYWASSEADIRPQEWVATASLGYRPWPESMPKLVLGVQGGYGIESDQAHVLAAVRYHLTSF